MPSDHLEAERDAPTGEFDWGGITVYKTDTDDDYGSCAPVEVKTVRVSGNYYHHVLLTEENRVDPTAIGDDPEMEMVGVTALQDYEEGEMVLADDPWVVFATPDGERWAAHQLQADIEEDTTDAE